MRNMEGKEASEWGKYVGIDKEWKGMSGEERKDKRGKKEKVGNEREIKEEWETKMEGQKKEVV